MPEYRYRTRDHAGLVSEGTIQSPSETNAMDTLVERGFTVLKIEETKKKLFEFLTTSFSHVSGRDIAIFSRQLAVLVGASVPVVNSLRIASRQTSNKTLSVVISHIADDIESGERVSAAMEKFPRVFDEFFVHMVRSGETAGRMSEVLEQLADEKEKDYDLMTRIRGALYYPAFIVAGIVAVSIVLMVFVLPQLTNVLTESGIALPFTTRMLIGVSHFLQYAWPFLIVLVIGAVILVRVGIQRSPGFRLVWDLYKLRIPIIGKLFQKIYITRFAQGLKTLTIGGVDQVSSLKVVAGAVGNHFYKDLIDQTIKHVEDGDSITTVFAKSRYVPAMVNQMLAVGEETGKMVEVLEKMTAFYRKEIDANVNGLVSIIEPIIMAGIGIGVGLVVSSVMLPMFRLTSQF